VLADLRVVGLGQGLQGVTTMAASMVASMMGVLRLRGRLLALQQEEGVAVVVVVVVVVAEMCASSHGCLLLSR